MSEAPTDWQSACLADICEFKYGRSLPGAARAGGAVRVYGSNGVVGAHHLALTQGETIVIGRKGSYGEINYSDQPCWPIDTTFYIDHTATHAHLKWLAYRLAAVGLNRMNQSAAVPGLNREDAYRVRILVPPIKEQRRIAAILDQADALRAQRCTALAHLDELATAVFLEMFAGNSDNSWPLKTIAEAAAPEAGAIRTGPFGSQLLHSEFVDSGIAILGIDNVVSNEFRWAERRYITEMKYERLKRYTVKPGDVLITIMGTCGRCAVVPDDVTLAINTKHLCCITLDRTKVLPWYLHSYFLRHPTARRYLEQTAKGAIMSGLNMGIIQAMPLLIPPLKIQTEFVSRLRSIESLKSSHRASLAHLDALFASLQHRAFRGEL